MTAARRIVWGKFLNAGQTCVAPDYVLVQEEAKEELLRQIVRCVEKFYPLRPELAEKFPHIVNERHFSRLLTLMEGEQAVIGGGWDRQALFIEPTVLDQVSWDSPVMQEEIFGPLLPVLAYRSWEEALSRIRAMPRPLAFYYFTGSRNRARRVFSEVECGGGCVNDTILHLTAQGTALWGRGEQRNGPLSREIQCGYLFLPKGRSVETGAPGSASALSALHKAGGKGNPVFPQIKSQDFT